MTRHKAGRLTYHGDCRHMVGEVKGPTNYGTHVVAVGAEYDEAADTTIVYFAHLGELDQLEVVADEFNILRIPTLAEAASR